MNLEDFLFCKKELKIKMKDFDVEFLKCDDKLLSGGGKFHNLPPEIINSKEELIGEKSDAWTLGVFLFTMVVFFNIFFFFFLEFLFHFILKYYGYTPFYEDNIIFLLSSICEGKMRYEESDKLNTPEDLKDLFNHIFVVDINQRYSCQDIINHPWFLKQLVWTKESHHKFPLSFQNIVFYFFLSAKFLQKKFKFIIPKVITLKIIKSILK